MVRQGPDGLPPADGQVKKRISNAPGMTTVLAGLMFTSSNMLKKQATLDLVFAPQFAPSTAALTAICHGIENYAAPARIPTDTEEASVNHSLAALVKDEELPLAQMPPEAVTWNSMPNVIWAMNWEKGLGVVFATQFLPVGNEKTVDLAMALMRAVWEAFG